MHPVMSGGLDLGFRGGDGGGGGFNLGIRGCPEA